MSVALIVKSDLYEGYVIRDLLKMGGSKMTRRLSVGKCSVCNGAFSKATMARHLKSCIHRDANKTQSGSHRSQEAEIIHLVTEERYRPEYWMHLKAPTNMTLKGLDAFLRRTWLECCGHLSAFTIRGKKYMIKPEKRLGEEGMEVALGRVLCRGEVPS